ncbi:MAG: hypothetical protein ACREUU_02510, partial [Gammaproteobacteria bacterium]
MSRFLSLAALLAGLLAPSLGWTQEKAPAETKAQPAKEKRASEQFMRVRKDKRGTPLSMDTAVVSYAYAD